LYEIGRLYFNHVSHRPVGVEPFGPGEKGICPSSCRSARPWSKLVDFPADRQHILARPGRKTGRDPATNFDMPFWNIKLKNDSPAEATVSQKWNW